jgi:hypothetical protein
VKGSAFVSVGNTAALLSAMPLSGVYSYVRVTGDPNGNVVSKLLSKIVLLQIQVNPPANATATNTAGGVTLDKVNITSTLRSLRFVSFRVQKKFPN